MTTGPHDVLKNLGISLQTPVAPVANYVPYRLFDQSLIVSGQISKTADGTGITGKLGDDLDVAQGYQAARLCAINILAQVNAALNGDLSRVVHCVRLGGFVNCTPAFCEQPGVVNGASDLIVEVFGESGRHARAAVGVAGLPLGVAVEVEALFRIRP